MPVGDKLLMWHLKWAIGMKLICVQQSNIREQYHLKVVERKLPQQVNKRTFHATQLNMAVDSKSFMADFEVLSRI